MVNRLLDGAHGYWYRTSESPEGRKKLLLISIVLLVVLALFEGPAIPVGAVLGLLFMVAAVRMHAANSSFTLFITSIVLYAISTRLSMLIFILFAIYIFYRLLNTLRLKKLIKIANTKPEDLAKITNDKPEVEIVIRGKKQ